MCNEMHLIVYSNTQPYKLGGFATETLELNLLEKLWGLEKLCDEEGIYINTVYDSNSNASQ